MGCGPGGKVSVTWRTGRYVELKAKQTCFIHRFPGTQPGVSHCCTQLDIFRLQPAASSRLITHSSLFRSSSGAWPPQPPFSAALHNTDYGLHHVSASATAQSPSRPPKWQDPFTAYRTKEALSQGAYISVYTNNIFRMDST